MKAITAFNKYKNSCREIFLQSAKEGFFVYAGKEKDFSSRFGSEVANARVVAIDEKESPGAVMIYLNC